MVGIIRRTVQKKYGYRAVLEVARYVQRGKKEGGLVDLAYVVHMAREKSVRAVLTQVASLDDILREEPRVIRVEE